MSLYKFGRLPRLRLPYVPHYSALTAGVPLPPPPPAIDNTVGMPGSLGVMLNDKLGCCTCSACGHAEQVWTYATTPAMETPPDSAVLTLYEDACDYAPSDPSTDQGGSEQIVLGWWLKQGFWGRQLAGIIEVDPRHTDDIKRVIWHCGVCYIGFNVPQFLADNLTAAGAVWDVAPNADNSIAGGHAVVLAGYTATSVRVISWGNYYTMTWPFFAAFTEECYGLADADWLKATGFTPAGLTLAELEAQMQAWRQAA